MVGKATVFIKSKNEEGVLPLRRVANSFINTLDKAFPSGNWGHRMERLIRAAFRVKVSELWEFSGFRICVKLLKRLLG